MYLFAEVVSWEKVVTIVVKTANQNTWFLITNRNHFGIADSYSKRFKIEKLFQDPKSSALDIEKTKIRNYKRVKRLVYLSAVCQSLMIFLGHFIKFTKKPFRSLGHCYSLLKLGMAATLQHPRSIFGNFLFHLIL
jgi:hypothetical protein